jgi:magnesium transporter
MEVLDAIDTTAIARLRERDEFFWLDLHAPDAAQVAQLGEIFGYHELALEDSIEFHQRPKLDDYGDHVLVVYYGVEGKELVEVHAYVSGDAIVTLHQGHCRALSAAFERLKRLSARSEEEAVYRVLDALTDSFFPRIEALDDTIDALLTKMTDGHHTGQRRQIFDLRREVLDQRRIVGPMRDVFTAGGMTIQAIPGLDQDTAHDYFRDVYDHLLRIAEALDSLRELLSGALDVYLSTQSNRLNEVMYRLTVISVIFLPLTFLTGFFGQNFGWMVDHVDSSGAFLGLGLGGLALSLALIGAWLRHSASQR